jgi:hypothetical protein
MVASLFISSYCLVWIWNFVSDIYGRTQIVGAEVNIGPKKEEVRGGRRKLHDDELYNLYSHNILFG